jgi:uncharacterized protein
MQFSRFNVETKTDDNKIIICNTLTGAICLLEEKEYMFVKDKIDQGTFTIDSTTLNENAILKNLLSGGIVIDETKNEILKALYLSNYAVYRSDHLDLRLLPTEDCNCRCIYCYESFEKGEMTDDTRNRVIQLLEKQAPRLKSLNIGWFGGEPLIAMKTIEEISHKILELKKKYDFKYTNHLTTNGYFLTEAIVRKLFSYEIKNIQVTLDGYGEKHDERKKLRSGKGTFDKIMKNLKMMASLEEDYQLTARINFDHENFESIKTLLEELKTIFHNDKRFSVFFRATGNWGGNNEISKINLVGNDKKENLQKELIKTFYGENSNSYQFPALNTYWCYASFPHCYTVGSDGKLYKCTVHFSDEINQVGIIDEEGNLKLDVNKISQWVSCGDDENCSACFMMPSCRGKNCAASRIINKKIFCPDIKNNIQAELVKYYNNLDKSKLALN